jgi:methionyl-tRNA formyltransferase
VVDDHQQAGRADIGRVSGADRSGLRVVCGIGELLLTELQRAGGKRVAAGEFLSGFPVRPGDRFVSPIAAAAE